MIKILIIDDSATEVLLLKKIFESVPGLEVVGSAANGKQGVELALKLKPDVITMDIDMPIMDGFEATKAIMTQLPIPIVVISAKVASEENLTFSALEAGALSVLCKPFNFNSPEFDREKQNIIDTVRSMSEIKVIKRRFKTTGSSSRKKNGIIKVPQKHGSFEIIAIGTSVGGPQALKTIISDLPADFPLPIVIVQHMAQGFTTGFVQWLDNMSTLKIKEAENFEVLKKGIIYFAPETQHLKIDRNNGELIAKLERSSPISGFCPSATVLLQSIARVCGANAIGILLTGMGNDGAQGLLELKQAHGHTLIQDPDSTVVFGMAGVAQSLNAVDKVVRLDQIARYLIEISRK